MKFCRAEISAPLGAVRDKDSMGNLYSSSLFPYFSTIQGILSRALGKTVYIDELLPIGVRFEYENTYGKNVDLMKTHKVKNGKYEQDLVYAVTLTEPRLYIYLPPEYCEKLKKSENPLYFGSPSYPASLTVKEVDLKPVKDFNGEIIPYGTYVRKYVPGSVLISGAYEFEYSENNIKYRKMKSAGKHLVLPWRYKKKNIEDFKKLPGAYVDEDFDVPRLVVIFDEHPKKIWGGE